MPYLTEDDLDLDFSEEDDDIFSEDDDDDEEGWDNESLIEARRRPRYRRKYSPGYRSRSGVQRPIAGLQGGVVKTPAGSAQIKFQKPVATKEAVEKLAKRVEEVIKKVDLDLDKNTKILDTKINAVQTGVKKAQQQMQQSMMLPLLMTTPPQIKSIKTDATAPTALGPGVTIPLCDDGTVYKTEDNTKMLLMLMMMSGGLGGGSQDSTNMMLMALIMSDAFKSKS